MRTFVVGDIHGHLRKLETLLPLLRGRAAPGDALVFVGDYIDRGPDSRRVVDAVLALRDGGWAGPVTTLKGNHEDLMLDSLEARPRFDPEIWLENGGEETIASYTGGAAAANWLEHVPPSHMEFFRGLRSYHEDENGIYVHAGLQPGARPEESTDDDLLWIRGPFINSTYRWEKVVVFGHTPQFADPPPFARDRSQLNWRPLVRAEKIGIDTGAAYGGPLTAVILPEREFHASR